MSNLFINQDGANEQAQAVLAYLRGRSGIDASYNSTRGCHDAEPELNRWHNCREQGYVKRVPEEEAPCRSRATCSWG